MKSCYCEILGSSAPHAGGLESTMWFDRELRLTFISVSTRPEFRMLR